MKHAYAHLNESNHEQVIIDLSDEEDDEGRVRPSGRFGNRRGLRIPSEASDEI